MKINPLLHPIQFIKYINTLEAEYEKIITRLKYRETSLQNFNGISVGELIEVLQEHQQMHGKSAPVQLEIITENEPVYKSVFDVVSSVDGICISNWPRIY